MRRLVDGGAAAAPLRGPLLMRSIGSGYDVTHPSAYFVLRVVPALFDLAMYVKETSASVLRPFGQPVPLR